MVEKLEYTHLRVRDVDAAVTFYTDVLGLTEYRREGDTVYLGCGLNPRYDLAVSPGGTGLDHFAIRVTAEEFERHVERLEAAGVETERRDDAVEGMDAVLRFSLPSGVPMEVVVVGEDERYDHVTETGHEQRRIRGPVAPDHINVITEDAERDTRFLVDHLDFRISEIQKSDGDWKLVHARYGDKHHDVAIEEMEMEGWGLHHLAWRTEDVSHMKTLIDAIARSGNEIELGLSRHVSGNNLFTYFWTPGGNRFELSTEMATLHEDTETTVHESRIIPPTAWGGIEAPESFGTGS
jgi:catechol 2,3-dioxygenase